MADLTHHPRGERDSSAEPAAANQMLHFSPSELVLLYPDCVSLSFPDSFIGSRPALVSGRHVDAMNVTPKLVHFALAALVSRGDITLSRQESPSRVLERRRVTLLMHALSDSSDWPQGSLEALLLAGARRDDDGAGVANAIATCIGGVSYAPHEMLYERLLEGLLARGVVETWSRRRLLLFRTRSMRLTPATRASISRIGTSDVSAHLAAFDAVHQSHAADIKRAHDTAIDWCTERGD